MITREQAIALGTTGHRREVHAGACVNIIGKRGGVTQKRQVWRVNGSCQTWVTRPESFSLPIKYGFNGPYGYITEGNAVAFHLADDCTPREVSK